MSSTDNTTNG